MQAPIIKGVCAISENNPDRFEADNITSKSVRIKCKKENREDAIIYVRDELGYGDIGTKGTTPVIVHDKATIYFKPFYPGGRGPGTKFEKDVCTALQELKINSIVENLINEIARTKNMRTDEVVSLISKSTIKETGSRNHKRNITFNGSIFIGPQNSGKILSDIIIVPEEDEELSVSLKDLKGVKSAKPKLSNISMGNSGYQYIQSLGGEIQKAKEGFKKYHELRDMNDNKSPSNLKPKDHKKWSEFTKPNKDMILSLVRASLGNNYYYMTDLYCLYIYDYVLEKIFSCPFEYYISYPGYCSDFSIKITNEYVTFMIVIRNKKYKKGIIAPKDLEVTMKIINLEKLKEVG